MTFLDEADAHTVNLDDHTPQAVATLHQHVGHVTGTFTLEDYHAAEWNGTLHPALTALEGVDGGGDLASEITWMAEPA